MSLKKFIQPFETFDFLPPAVLLEDSEDSPDDISEIGATSHIAGQSSILNDDEGGSGMVKDNVKLLNWKDGLFDVLWSLVDIA